MFNHKNTRPLPNDTPLWLLPGNEHIAGPDHHVCFATFLLRLVRCFTDLHCAALVFIPLFLQRCGQEAMQVLTQVEPIMQNACFCRFNKAIVNYTSGS